MTEYEKLIEMNKQDEDILNILKKHLIFVFNGTQYGFQFYGIDKEIARKLSNYFCANVLDFGDTKTIKIKKSKAKEKLND
jgi:hypothetical protein